MLEIRNPAASRETWLRNNPISRPGIQAATRRSVERAFALAVVCLFWGMVLYLILTTAVR